MLIVHRSFTDCSPIDGPKGEQPNAAISSAERFLSLVHPCSPFIEITEEKNIKKGNRGVHVKAPTVREQFSQRVNGEQDIPSRLRGRRFKDAARTVLQHFGFDKPTPIEFEIVDIEFQGKLNFIEYAENIEVRAEAAQIMAGKEMVKYTPKFMNKLIYVLREKGLDV